MILSSRFGSGCLIREICMCFMKNRVLTVCLSDCLSLSLPLPGGGCVGSSRLAGLGRARPLHRGTLSEAEPYHGEQHLEWGRS